MACDPNTSCIITALLLLINCFNQSSSPYSCLSTASINHHRLTPADQLLQSIITALLLLLNCFNQSSPPYSC
jgi:hypothetical protein